MGMRSDFAGPLGNRDFRRLWCSVLVSNIGSMAQNVGAGWMMATIAQSDTLVALVQASTTLPVMLFSLMAGALADSIDRRRQMLAGQSLMFVMSIVLAVMTYAELVTPAILLGCTFVIGCGTALHIPATQASVSDLVPRAQIPSAVSLNSMSYNVTRSVGPALGGVLVAAAGPAAAFAANAVSYLPVLVSLLLWTNPRPATNLPREPFLRAIGAGVKYVAMSPHLVMVLARAFLFSFAGVSVLALLPLVARDALGGNSRVYGTLLASFGVGAVAGVFGGFRLRAAIGNENLVRVTSLCFAASVSLLAASGSEWLACLCLLPAGACWVATMSLFNTAMQLWTPRWVIGRSMSLYQAATFGGMAAGSWLWGAVAAATSPAFALLAGSACVVSALAVGLRHSLPGAFTLDLTPLGQFTEPVLGMVIQGDASPILIQVEYRIDDADVPAFVAVMQVRRRARIRDGARRWQMLRDLQAPGIWIESYVVPGWSEYVRHHSRRTRADAAVLATLRALHRGDTPPRVRRLIEEMPAPESPARKVA